METGEIIYEKEYESPRPLRRFLWEMIGWRNWVFEKPFTFHCWTSAIDRGTWWPWRSWRRAWCLTAPLYSSADRRFRKWEDVVLDSFACNEDPQVSRRDESDTTAVELSALHHELAVDPLRWFDDFEMENTGIRRMPYTSSCKGWSTSGNAGTYDQSNWGGVAAMEELAKQIQSWWCLQRPWQRELVRFTFWLWNTTSWRRPGAVSSVARCPSNQGFQGNRARSTTLSWTRVVVQAAKGPPRGGKVEAPGTVRKESRSRERPATSKMLSLLAATLGPTGGVATGHMDSGGLGVALPCASARLFRLFPEVFGDCSYICRRLSPRDRAITRELSWVGDWRYWLFLVMRKGGVSHIVHSPSITSTSPSPLCDLWLQATKCCWVRRGSSSETARESCYRRLFVVFWWSCSGIADCVPSSRVARPQDASKAPHFVSLLSSSARSHLDSCMQRMLRPVSETADMETWLWPASRFIDPVLERVGFEETGWVDTRRFNGGNRWLDDGSPETQQRSRSKEEKTARDDREGVKERCHGWFGWFSVVMRGHTNNMWSWVETPMWTCLVWQIISMWESRSRDRERW